MREYNEWGNRRSRECLVWTPCTEDVGQSPSVKALGYPLSPETLKTANPVPFVPVDRSACCNAAEVRDLEINFLFRLPHASANRAKFKDMRRTYPLQNKKHAEGRSPDS